MDERNGSFREIKKNSFDRTGKYDHVFTESTNFEKDLKKYCFLRNEQFLEQTFKKRKFFTNLWKTIFFTERTILLIERFRGMNVQWENERYTWKINYDSEKERYQIIEKKNEMNARNEKSRTWPSLLKAFFLLSGFHLLKLKSCAFNTYLASLVVWFNQRNVKIVKQIGPIFVVRSHMIRGKGICWIFEFD